MRGAKVFSREVAKHGITVNCIQPGRISSEQMLRMYSTEEKRRAFTQEVPIPRFGEPRELADLARAATSPPLTGDLLTATENAYRLPNRCQVRERRQCLLERKQQSVCNGASCS